jgi:hypothetical protein
MDTTYRKLEEIVIKKNDQRVTISTYKDGICYRCKSVCDKQHHSLEIEYHEIRQVMRNLNSYREPQICYNHEQETYHIPFRCPKNRCDKCGKQGHARQMCDNELYFWNRLHHCGCNLKTVKRNKSRMQNGGGNHCCTCLTPIKFKDAYTHFGLMKLKCEDCFKGKRPLTPESEEDRKRTRFEIPEPEDPIKDMELDPITPNKGKLPEIRCLECSNTERTMNPINELGICQKCEIKRIALERYGSRTTIRQCHVCKKHTDSYNSRAGGEIVCGQECNDVMSILHKVYKDKSRNPVEQVIEEKIKVMVTSYENENEEENVHDTQRLTLMVNKYLNKEFKEELLYPKSEVTNVLNEQLPRELAEIITNNLGEDAELRNTEPIKTNISNIEWSESSVITQPWELNGEFEWKEEGLNVEIFEASTVNQEPHNSEMTNLKNQIKELKDAVERQDTYIYNLSNKYLEACKGYNESLKVIKEKENYIKKLIKSYNYFTEEQEVKINDLNLERENLKSELENEKLVNDFINQYMYPIAETTSMEDLEL